MSANPERLVIDQLDKRLGEMRDSLNRLDDKVENRFQWMLGVQLGSWLTLMLAMFFKH